MKKLRDYEIGIAKLSNRKHLYEFEMDDSFFDLFGRDIIQGGNLQAKVELDKSETLLTLSFEIKGHVKLTCDRSLEEFDQPIDLQETFRMKFGPEDAEIDDDIWQIAYDTQQINVAQHLYDFVALSLPMKKLHPRFVNEQGEEEEDEQDILIYSSRNAAKEEGTDGNDEDDEDIDPRWNALRNLN